MEYSKVDETTIKVTQTVEQVVTKDQLLAQREDLAKSLGGLEAEYAKQKENYLNGLKVIDEALAEAEKMQLKTQAEISTIEVKEEVEVIEK